MNTADFATTSRLHPTSKEDLTSANHRSFDIDAKFRDFCAVLGLDPSQAGGKITFVGEDPILPSRHRLGACISIPLMAAAVGAATIWRMRSGRGQDLQLGLRKAIHGCLDTLPAVVEAAGKTPVLFDSGVRTGSDIVKALALGATAVGIGRPYAWGLALDGTDGVVHVLRCLLAEADLLMANDGYPTIGDLRSAALLRN